MNHEVEVVAIILLAKGIFRGEGTEVLQSIESTSELQIVCQLEVYSEQELEIFSEDVNTDTKCIH